MYEARFYEPHKLGLTRLTGSNRGLVYTNERTVTETNPETDEQREVYVYDVYEVSDARNPSRVKDEVITAEHPFGDETKILRKTIAKMLKSSGQYDDPAFAEFKSYNEFVEDI